METLMEQKLTEQQAKMVIEFLSEQAAQDYPDGTFQEIEKHTWLTRYTASLAIERQITERDWEDLLNAQIVWQSFDRDPEGWLNERGFVDFGYYKHADALKDMVSSRIDNCYRNSGA